MAEKMIFLDSELRVKDLSEDGNTLRVEGYANCTTKDRAGDIILEDAWKGDALADFEKNPIVLAFHDHTRPIGKIVDHRVDSKGLHVVAEVYKAAGDVFSLIQQGVLKAFSVGFRIEEADYDTSTDIFLIKALKLLEISVVSVPCNQDSIFSLAKSFESEDDLAKFKQQFSNSELTDMEPASTSQHTEEDSIMPEDINKTVADAVAAAMAAQDEQRATLARLETEKKAEEARITALVASGTEQLLKDLEAKHDADKEAFGKTVKDLQDSIAEKADEIAAIRAQATNKMVYGDRTTADGRGGVTDKEIEDAVLVSKMTNKPIQDTRLGRALKEKAANASSSAEVSSDTYYETVVSTNLERDMQDLLVVQPLFREIQMAAANQIIPINPNATTATWVPVAQISGGSRDNTTTGAEITKTLTEISLKTYKLAGKSYITDETDEDAIMPLLPLIREGLVEAHALTIDDTFINGSASTDNPTGLIELASNASNDVETAAIAATDRVTAKMLLAGRRQMGQWGLDMSNLRIIVSLDAYWDLLEDDNFSNLNEVGAQATKLTGQVGMMYGLPVLVSTRMPAKANGGVWGIIVNTRNFLVPRQRGFVVQSEYLTESQRRVLVATQRLGFNSIIANNGVATLTYDADGA